MSNMPSLVIGLAGVAIILKVPREGIGQARQRTSSYARLGAGAYRSYPESKNMHHSHLNKLKALTLERKFSESKKKTGLLRCLSVLQPTTGGKP